MNEQEYTDYFFSLYKEYFERLVAYARSYLYNEEDSLESVQETFRVIWEKRDKLQIPFEHASAFLFRAVRNRCLNSLKRNTTEKKNIQNLIDRYRDESSEEEKMMKREVAEKTLIALHAELSEMERSVVILRFLHGMGQQEIAEITETSVATVSRVLKFLTREKLKKIMEKYDIDFF